MELNPEQQALLERWVRVITAAAALERGGLSLMHFYYIPYSIYRGGQRIYDAEWEPGEHYTIAGILAHSSNIGMSQVVQSVPPKFSTTTCGRSASRSPPA